MRRPRPVLAAAAALVTVAALAACTASGTSSSSAAGGSSGGKAPAAAEAGAAGSSADFAAGSSSVPSATDRQIVRTGSLSLVSDHPIAASNRIQSIVTGAGGTIADSTQDPKGDASADLTLRIPSAVFDTTLADIEHQGDVRNVTVKAVDVTSTVTDYTIRIANLKTSITRLQQLLAKATSSSALVEIEGSLTDREGQLEQLLAQQKTLDDQVADATLTVSIVVPARAPAKGPDDFVTGLVAGWHGLVATLASMAVALGVVLPWAVLLGALGGAGWIVRRMLRRRASAA